MLRQKHRQVDRSEVAGEADGVNWFAMENDSIETPEKPTATDWEALRAQAAKLGITLSELQQQQRERQARLARKSPFKRP